MIFIKKIFTPEWAIRISLGVMYMYTGFSIVLHPTSWYWAIRGLPIFIQDTINNMGIDLYLRIQGSVEILFAIIFLAWFLPKWIPQYTGLVVAAQMFLILVFLGIDLETYRDLGILGAGLALFILLDRKESAR